MKNIHMKNLFILCCLLWSTVPYAQQDSIQTQDSLNTAKLAAYNAKLMRIEAERVEDSIKKVALEAEISSLKTTDNLKKEDLLQQLQEIQNKENSRLAEKKAQIEAMRSNAKGYPVNGFFNDTLLLVYNKSGSFQPKERADAISERIKKLASMITFNEQTLTTEGTEIGIDLKNGSDIIISITETDALWNNTTLEDLAIQYKTTITNAVINYQKETSLFTLLKEIGIALLIIIIMIVMLKYVGKLFKLVGKKIDEQKGKRIKSLQLKNYTLFDEDRLVGVFHLLNNLVKWMVYILLIYITLPILFGVFPWTQGFAQTLFGYILNPLKKMTIGVWGYLPNLFTIIVIFVVFRYIIKAIRFLKVEIEQKKLVINGFYPDWANPTFQILRVILYAFMFTLIYNYLPGSDSAIFKGVSVFLGFLFTFGSAGSLSNVISGIVLTYMRLFRIGDRVKIGDVTGDVIEKSMLVTRIKTTKNEIISIPNSTVMNSHTINYTSETTKQGLILHTTVTLGYDVPWKLVHETLINAADRTERLLKDPKPFVLQTSLDDFYVAYQINAYTKEADKQAKIYSDLHQNIQDCCNEVGIEILSPHYRAARDGNMSTIPANYLPKDYKIPGFNFNMNKNK